MTSTIQHRPGSQHGPCVVKCDHVDCAVSRETAESRCTICGERIGYDTPFVNDHGRPCHLSCFQGAVEVEITVTP